VSFAQVAQRYTRAAILGAQTKSGSLATFKILLRSLYTVVSFIAANIEIACLLPFLSALHKTSVLILSVLTGRMQQTAWRLW